MPTNDNPLRWFLLIAVGLWLVPNLPGDEPAALEAQPLAYWIEQLNSDRFLRRQSATQEVLKFGDDAVPALLEVAKNGQLELTERALSVLATLALRQPPDDPAGAFGSLTELAEQGGGSAAVRAAAALESIHHERQLQAVERLTHAGLKVGFREFMLGSRSRNENVVWIDSQWSGDRDALRWLRWLPRVPFAIIEGTAVNEDVIKAIATVPDLTTIIIREAKIDTDIVTPLALVPRIDELEFRYVKLTDADADKIAKLPIRVQLSLMGTGLSEAAANNLRTVMPGLSINWKQGGFLGVMSSNLSPRCQIDNLVEGGAAAASGLMPGDVITDIDGVPIANFDDLQKTISTHIPDEELAVTFERHGEIKKTTVTLQMAR